MRTIREDIERTTPGMSQKLNRSISIRGRDESLMDVSIRLQDYKRRKSENIKKIINKMNQVNYSNQIFIIFNHLMYSNIYNIHFPFLFLNIGGASL